MVGRATCLECIRSNVSGDFLPPLDDSHQGADDKSGPAIGAIRPRRVCPCRGGPWRIGVRVWIVITVTVLVATARGTWGMDGNLNIACTEQKV